MKLIKSVGSFFALDIGTTSVRVVQLAQIANGSWALQHFGYASVDSKITASNSEESMRRLSNLIITAVGESGISTKDVVIGLPAGKTFTTVIDVPKMPENELKATIKYQVDQYIPMSADEAKYDWVLLGPSPVNEAKQEVLLTSTANEYAEERLEFIEGMGFNVIGAEPEPIAMIRSLLPAGVQDVRLIVDMGEQDTNLAITYGDAPRLVRTIPVGMQTLVKVAVQNLNVQEDQARQFITKFGFATDKLEGQVFRALESTIDGFADELIKSIKFFTNRYQGIPFGSSVVSGFAGSIPGFAEFIAGKTGFAATPTDPWQKVQMSQQQQQQVSPVSSEFATAIGLAQRSDT